MPNGNSLDYAQEKYTKAVLLLARGTDGLRERIRAAWKAQGHYALPGGRDGSGNIPEDLQDRMADLQHRLSEMPAAADGQGTIDASIDLLEDGELPDVATEIVAIANELTREVHQRMLGSGPPR